jgi:predicted regulator of Ras-like GTPase activity (Roadblock/LC7/MglB family)
MNGNKMGTDYPEMTGGDNLRSGLVLYPTHYQTIDQILLELVQKIPARFVLLTDVTGQVVSAHGDQSQIDLVALGSLIAGDLAASQEIARLTGQYQSYQLILREGLLSHTFITEAGQQFVLFVQTPGDTPLGWARMLIRRGPSALPSLPPN